MLWLRGHGDLFRSNWCKLGHFLPGRFSSSATHSNSCLTTGLSGKPLAVSMAFASSGVSLANCGAVYFFFRPDSESGVDLLGSAASFRMAFALFLNNSPSGPSANLDYEVVLISEQASSRMEYEDALPGDSNSALHYPKASPRKLLRGIGAQAVTNPAKRWRNGQRYPNQGHFRHSRSSGARHSDLQNEEESTEIDSGGYQRKFRSGQTSAWESPVALGYFG